MIPPLNSPDIGNENIWLTHAWNCAVVILFEVQMVVVLVLILFVKNLKVNRWLLSWNIYYLLLYIYFIFTVSVLNRWLLSWNIGGDPSLNPRPQLYAGKASPHNPLKSISISYCLAIRIRIDIFFASASASVSASAEEAARGCSSPV